MNPVLTQTYKKVSKSLDKLEIKWKRLFRWFLQIFRVIFASININFSLNLKLVL
jgi:hypothetical protein